MSLIFFNDELSLRKLWYIKVHISYHLHLNSFYEQRTWELQSALQVRWNQDCLLFWQLSNCNCYFDCSDWDCPNSCWENFFGGCCLARPTVGVQTFGHKVENLLTKDWRKKGIFFYLVFRAHCSVIIFYFVFLRFIVPSSTHI